MNSIFKKTLYKIYRVFFVDFNKVGRLPEVSEKYAGKIVLKIHPKGFYMQLKSYGKDGQSKFDIDLHGHDEDEKEYSHNGIHIHEYELKYIKKFKTYKYIRQKGRNLTDEEYENYIKNLDIESLIKIQVNYI